MSFKTKSQELYSTAASKRQAAKDILSKDVTSITEAEEKSAMAMIDEAKSLEIQAKEFEQKELVRAENEAALAGLKTSDSPAHTDGAKLEGFKDAGHTVIAQQQHGQKGSLVKVLHEEGELGMSEKDWNAISSKSYKDAFQNYLRKGHTGVTSNELKTLNEGADTEGGFLVPEEFLDRIVQKLATPTRVASRVTTFNTGRDTLVMPRVNYTADDIYTTGIRATWTGEQPTSTAHLAATPAFGEVRIPVHTCMLSLDLTNNMVEDTSFNIVGWTSGKFTETVDLLQDNMIINGSGIGQPAGFLLNPDGANQPAVVVSGNGTALTADGIIDLAYSLPEQYDQNAVFLMNKTSTGRAIAKLKDSQNRYLFGMGDQESGIAAARPRELVGYPYIYSGFMPNVAANAFPLAFGDLRGYYRVNRVGFSVQVLREVQALNNRIVLLGRIRFGGQMAEPWRMKIQKVST